MLGLERAQIIGRELGVGIVLRLGADVHDDQRHDEVLDRDLVGGLHAVAEMDRRVHVRAGVLDQQPALHVVAVLGQRHERLHPEIAAPR